MILIGNIGVAVFERFRENLKCIDLYTFKTQIPA